MKIFAIDTYPQGLLDFQAQLERVDQENIFYCMSFSNKDINHSIYSVNAPVTAPSMVDLRTTGVMHSRRQRSYSDAGHSDSFEAFRRAIVMARATLNEYVIPSIRAPFLTLHFTSLQQTPTATTFPTNFGPPTALPPR